MSQIEASDAPVALDRRTVWRALALFWAAFVSLNTVRALLLGFPHLASASLRRLAVAVLGAGLSWGLCRALDVVRQRASGRGTLLAILALSLPAAFVFGGATIAVFDYLAPVQGDSCGNGRLTCTPQEAFSAISELTINWSFVFAAWGLLYVTLSSAVRLRAVERQANAYQEASRLAEIRALRYQINPHFLFNVLNSLSALVRRRDSDEAERLIGEMGRFLRFSLSVDPVADIPLLDEVDMQLRYLEIERWRFPNRMTVEVDIALAAEAALVPALILQPLVENAVKHGVGRTTAPVRIKIRASVDPQRRLRLLVSNDAPPAAGPGDIHAPPTGFGIGLKNVSERLAARYGTAAQCTAGPEPKGGFRVELVLPLAPGRG